MTRRETGFAAIYLVFAFLLLLPLAGLAIDMSVLYNVKGRLQAACDAGAIGAGSTLQRSSNLSDPAVQAAIQAASLRYFGANFQAGYWGASQVSYSATPAENINTKVRTITVTASERVPTLFLRVLGITTSTVAATATVSVRFVTMMIVVDRSGSVLRAGADTVIKNSLNTFVTNAATSYLADGRDVVGLGSFGGSWNLDAAPVASFRSGIGNAINSLPFANSGTNTSEGLFQGYSRLQALNNTGSLNVIVLLTDGRPSALTVQMNLQSTCSTKGNKTGVITAIVGQQWPPLPPQTQGGAQGSSTINNLGLFSENFQGLGGVFAPSDMYYVPNSSGCQYNSDPTRINQDVASFPTADVHGNNTTGPVYQGEGQSMSNPRALRYAAFNAADNQATKIRLDTTIRPVLFVIGLNEPPAGGEPLDADWLARVANDPSYVDANGNSVFQAGQTPGMYFNVNAAGLGGAFQQITSQILRLSR